MSMERSVQGPLDRFADGFGAVLRVLNSAASFGIIALMILICADIAARNLFNRPVDGVPEIVKTAIVAIGWLQFAYALRTNRHLRSTLFFDSRSNRTKLVIYGLNCLMGAIVCGLIAWLCSDNVLSTFQKGTFEGELPVRIKVWPVWLTVTLGAALMTLEYLLQLLHCLGGTLPFGSSEPAAFE